MLGVQPNEGYLGGLFSMKSDIERVDQWRPTEGQKYESMNAVLQSDVFPYFAGLL